MNANSVPQIFEPDYYQRLYDLEEQHWWARGMRAAMVTLLARSLAEKRGLRVLDVGCGTGYLLDFLKAHYPLDGEVMGIDVSSHALKFCELRGAKRLMLASATELPFADSSFDLIICIDTLQHLAGAGADQVALGEFARVLAGGGVLYLRTNSALGRRPLAGVDGDQYRRYTVEDVKALLTSTGFGVERATYVNALPGLVGALREYLRPQRHSHHASGPGLAIRPYPPNLAWLNELMYGVSSFEAKLLGGMDLPFGHSSAFVARRLLENHS
ncbi:class I SAM-dependent methyltransferase [Anthocerotibacter panamensis]|uniref:class I SAM-dependent methyltransferase n=1 Tax=Anthocerotibacter panamensis TaxID=2857077 RepID=UPI001C401EBD|nr:class I SAM-dependent methyltransferase [Anthocerotibacter panamensis]